MQKPLFVSLVDVYLDGGRVDEALRFRIAEALSALVEITECNCGDKYCPSVKRAKAAIESLEAWTKE